MATSRGPLKQPQRLQHHTQQNRVHTTGNSVPPSPTLTATTAASQLDLGDHGPPVVITRADLRASIQAQENLLVAAKGYRNSMVALSNASTVFASALEECARVKGAGESGDYLLAASGLQYMVANSGQVLSDTLYRSFEVPLMHAYDAYVSVTAARHAEYESLLAERTAAIRQTEADNLRQGRKKSRDLAQFRRALERLQEQVREVEAVKGSYYSEVLDSEEECWQLVQTKVALIIRSTLDLSDRLASKATSDPLVESMLNEHPDPFDSYRPQNEKEERDVFTVLPPLGMNLGMSIGGGSGAASITGSRKGSVADLDLQAGASSHQGSSGSVLTPRQSRSKVTGMMSPSEVLGIDNVPDEDAQTPRRTITSNGRTGSRPGSSTAVQAVTSHDADTSSISSVSTSPQSALTEGDDGVCARSEDTTPQGVSGSATTAMTGTALKHPSASTSQASAGPDSPSPAAPSKMNSHDRKFDQPTSPVAHIRTSLFRSPVKSRRRAKGGAAKGSHKGAGTEEARLSRVSEDPAALAAAAAEAADVMAGDWSTGANEAYAYTRGIATGMEDDGGWDSG